MKRKTLVYIIIIAIAALITIRLCSNKQKLNEKKNVVNRDHIPVYISAHTVASETIKENLNLPAVLEASEAVSISAGVPGKIETLNIELGDRISKGQTLGTIDSKVKILNLKALELTTEKSKRDYERNVELLKGKAINEIDVINSKYAYDNNLIQAAQLRQQIEDAKIIAPITGTITEKNLRAGEFANSGTLIAKAVNNDKLKTVVYVNEKDAYRIKEGQAVTITSDVFPGQSFPGTVSFVSSAGDDNHNYKVETILLNHNSLLKSGTYVQVQFKTGGSSTAVVIPKRALGGGVKDPYVFVIKNDKAIRTPIVLGREVGENFEVLSGLSVGEQVVIDGIINVIDGSNVKVMSTI